MGENGFDRYLRTEKQRGSGLRTRNERHGKSERKRQRTLMEKKKLMERYHERFGRVKEGVIGRE